MEQTQLKVWIPLKLHQDFKVSCTLNQTSMTQVIGELITEYLKETKRAV
jgi:hypothetical protein